MTTSAKSDQAFTGFLPDSEAWVAALPAFFVLVAVELQRHWHGSVRWLYLAAALWLAAIWIGTLAKRAWALRHALAAIDAAVFALLLGSGFFTLVVGGPEGPELSATLLFWSPLLCAWWGFVHADRGVRLVGSAAALYVGLFAFRAASGPPFYEHVILGALMIALVRRAGGGYPRVQDGAAAGMPDTVLRDAATGVASPTYFEAELAHTAAVANRYHQLPFLLIVYDIDRYAQHAAEFGRSAMAGLMKRFSWAVADRVRVADTVCRWEEGKIVVLLPNTGLAEGSRVAQDIGLACRQISLPDGRPLQYRVGIAEHRYGDDPMTTLGVASESLAETAPGPA